MRTELCIHHRTVADINSQHIDNGIPHLWCSSTIPQEGMETSFVFNVRPLHVAVCCPSNIDSPPGYSICERDSEPESHVIRSSEEMSVPRPTMTMISKQRAKWRKPMHDSSGVRISRTLIDSHVERLCLADVAVRIRPRKSRLCAFVCDVNRTNRAALPQYVHSPGRPPPSTSTSAPMRIAPAR